MLVGCVGTGVMYALGGRLFEANESFRSRYTRNADQRSSFVM